MALKPARLNGMRVLSDPTLGLVVEVVVEVAPTSFLSSDLKTMLLRADLWRFAADHMASDQELVRSSVLAARNYCDIHGGENVEQGLLSFVLMIVERAVQYPDRAPEWFGELCEALLADGYELRWELDEYGWASRYQFLPTGGSPIPLRPQISALETELSSRGYSDALNHYRQAVDAFARRDHEAANSQLRPALEDLVMRLAKDHTSYVRSTKAGDGGNAIRHLTREPALAAGDGGDMLEGLWKMIHTNGPHPGRSDADETRFRLHVITATARLLLHRFPPHP